MNPFAALIESPRMAWTPLRRQPRRAEPKPLKRQYDNPWQLSPCQRAAIDAVVRHGSEKAAAAELGLSFRTVERHLRACREKMRAPHRVLALLEWDRYIRSRA